MRIAAIQLSVNDGEPFEPRISRALSLVRAQRGTDLVVLPELWVPGAFGYSGYEASASDLDSGVVASVAEAARSLGAYVVAGTFIERSEGRLYNTGVLLSPSGSIVHTYRKMHLFGFSGGEADLLAAGSSVSVGAVGSTPAAVTTCYDLRFPELYREFVNLGAELFVIPTGWPAARLEHWRVLTRARAIENQVFLVGCNQVGTQEGVELGGHSVVVDPWGQVLAEAGTCEEVLSVEIDLGLVAKIREEFPVLRDRRLGLRPPTG